MKAKILVGAMAALLYSGMALANDKDCPEGYTKSDTQAKADTQQMKDEHKAVIETQPVDQSVGGSGQAGMDESSMQTKDEGLGGSGQVSAQSDRQMILRCEPVRNGAGTGGSGSIDQNYNPNAVGGSGYQNEPLAEPQVTPPAAPVVTEPNNGAFTPTQPVVEQKEENKPGLRGLSLTIGGGVEGYSGALAPEINPGPAYGVQAAIRPSKVLGVELGYSGAVNNLDSRVGGGASSGPDLVRNGGQAALTLGLTATPVQPYVLGGVGFSHYDFRGSTGSTGFRDDTAGNVPVGAGLRTQIGDFTADLRADYNFLFSQDFAPGVDEGVNGNGRYAGTLNIGGTF